MGNDEGCVIGDDRRRLLLQVARVLFPHTGLSGGPYERAVAALVAQATRSPVLQHSLLDGLVELDEALQEDQAPSLLDALDARQHTAFFRSVRTAIAFALYDDHEVWAYVGYPGASFHLGGYLHRGFNDLTWLPEPRIVEAPHPMPEVGPLTPPGELTA